MKFLKHILIITFLIAINPLNAKRTGATTQAPTVQPTQPIVTMQPQIQPQPKPLQQPIRKSKSYGTNYKELLNYVRSLQQNEILTSNGFLTDDIIQFLGHVRKNFPPQLSRALYDAVLLKYMPWTGDSEKDNQKITLILENLESPKPTEKPIIRETPQPNQSSKPQVQPKPFQQTMDSAIKSQINSKLTNDLLFDNFNAEKIYTAIREIITWIEKNYNSDLAKETFKQEVLRKLSDLTPENKQEVASEIISKSARPTLLEIGMQLKQTEQQEPSGKQTQTQPILAEQRPLTNAQKQEIDVIINSAYNRLRSEFEKEVIKQYSQVQAYKVIYTITKDALREIGKTVPYSLLKTLEEKFIIYFRSRIPTIWPELEQTMKDAINNAFDDYF